MSDILQTILARKAEEIRERSARVPILDLAAHCFDMPDTRGFAAALEAKIAAGLPAVIAVVPAYVLIFKRLSVPLPALVNLPGPDITPL